MFLECGNDTQGLDAFVRVSRDLPAFNRPAPVVLEAHYTKLMPSSVLHVYLVSKQTTLSILLRILIPDTRPDLALRTRKFY